MRAAARSVALAVTLVVMVHPTRTHACNLTVGYRDPSTGNCVLCGDGKQVEPNLHTGGGACVDCAAGTAGLKGTCTACNASAGYSPNVERSACYRCAELGSEW